MVATNIRLIAGGLLIPNLLSLLTMSSLVDIGLPPRTGAILLYACVAVLARRLPFPLTVALFFAVLALDAVSTLSLMFGMAPAEFVAAIEHAQRIQFFASPLYAVLIVTVAVTAVGALACLRSRRALAAANVPVFFALTLGIVALDYLGNISPHYHLGALMGGAQPVRSAAEISGFTASAETSGRNVVLVMVESLGYLRDPEARAQIAAPLDDQGLGGTYTVTAGHTNYFGSTTAGEMRELCGTPMFYRDYVAQDSGACLPGRLARRGYSTMALHGFAGRMFEREDWYPIVGFDRMLFRPDLIKATGHSCGGPFRGACDAELAPLITAAAPGPNDGPRFIYWLTLNSHVPVALGDAHTDFHCGADGGRFGDLEVCRMAELWRDVFDIVAGIARDPTMDRPEILLVGDHAPPLWSKRGRAQFEPGQVAWYRLQPQSAPPAQLPASASSATR
ncbi:sulfatase-like hydrolase/transferase [Rhodopseudomonas sp. HC1]|uniref:sulfatase-like hydrolase/transferase n=1 Tax=Rhodopseudomonas infernalis TaxID=2897386 RepID=UPI001EE7D5B3|nr:sulfatase-like hydrolase/transferase [Rhodopseudomonas infernalis]MCG6206029.1 sulfatase-like hydrolase/transferase [Rhodopseudomonas infernalis]